jgi:DNA-binding transcriptional LysR family regulator
MLYCSIDLSHFGKDMDTLLNLRAFLATARLGSFSEAARRLNVVPSVVAKRVAYLERTLGVPLFQRSTRRVTLTESGQTFLAKARPLVEAFDGIVAGMGEAATGLEGHLRLKAPTSLTVLYLARILSAFQRAHDRVTLEVVLLDRSVNPLEEGFDLAIGGLPASYGGVVDEPLCPLHQVVCASPAYLARRGTPQHPRELVDHDGLVFRPTGATWMFRTRRGPINVDVPVKLAANDTYMLFAAACAGNGIAVLSTYVAQAALHSGELVAILSEFPLEERWLKALVPEYRVGTQPVDELLQWLKEHLSPVPPWEPAPSGNGLAPSTRPES